MDLAGRQPDLVLQVAVRAERAHHRRLPPLPAPLHPPQAGLPAQLALRRPPPPSRRRDAAPRRVPPRPPHRVARRGAPLYHPGAQPLRRQPRTARAMHAQRGAVRARLARLRRGRQGLAPHHAPLAFRPRAPPRGGRRGVLRPLQRRRGVRRVDIFVEVARVGPQLRAARGVRGSHALRGTRHEGKAAAHRRRRGCRRSGGGRAADANLHRAATPLWCDGAVIEFCVLPFRSSCSG
mmetsp:Transcript_22949/g.74941  ORF Transcript_22949/g.74941 Transcript_22949/m.74941 type:complete len:236 (-) Transcript_22949:68-775(-)